jgi:hypothetical protein
MACIHFKKGFFAVCSASDSGHVPGIYEMERFCFKNNGIDCPLSDVPGEETYKAKGNFAQQESRFKQLSYTRL